MAYDDSLCFLMDNLDAEHITLLDDFQLASGILYGDIPLEFPILNNIDNTEMLLSILTHKRKENRGIVPSYYPDHMVPGTILIVDIKRFTDLLDIVTKLSSSKSIQIYLIIKITNNIQWLENEEKRMKSTRFDIILPYELEKRASSEFYLLLQLVRSGHTRIDPTFSSKNLVGNALNGGALGIISTKAFFMDDLAFKTGISPKFGS